MAVIDIAAISFAVASATGDLVIKNSYLEAYSTGFATSVSALSVKNSRLEAYSTGFATSLSAIGMRKSLAADGAGRAESSAVLSVSIKLSATSTAVATTACNLTPRNTLGVGDVVNEVLNLWGIEGVCNAPDFALARAISDVNSAMQTVWNQADERYYWSSETLTLTFADGESSQDLPTDIQNVVGPCRRSDNKRPLAAIGSIGELETFSDIFLDGQTADEPLAYHVERMNQTGHDPVKSVLRITPAVTGASVAFLLDVVREAPRYTLGDIGLSPAIPIPHRYAESLLMPIVRYKASSFWLFNNTDSKATIDRDYQLAMNAIGLADPSPAKTLEKEGAPAK